MRILFVSTNRLEWHNYAEDFVSRRQEARRKVDGDDGGKDCHGRDTKEDGCIVLI
jgi:hypothetical protein